MNKFQTRCFEDIQVGDIAVSHGRTITEADIVNFAGLSGDWNTIHIDAEFAKSSITGQRVAHGLLGLAVGSGLYTRTEYSISTMSSITAFTEIRSWKFKKPISIGDTLRIESEIIEKDDPRPESGSGRVVFRRTIFNQNNEVVQTGEIVQLIKKR